jgi:hypothetical protein
MRGLEWSFWGVFLLKWLFYLISFATIFGLLFSIPITTFTAFEMEMKLEEWFLTYPILFQYWKIGSLLGLSISFLTSFYKMFKIEIRGNVFRLSEACSLEKIEEVSLFDTLPLWRSWLWKSMFQTAFVSLILEISGILNFYSVLISLLILGAWNILYIFGFHEKIAVCKKDFNDNS